MAIFLNTPMIRVQDKQYPRYIQDIRPDFPNMSIPDMMMDDASLEPYGFAVVYPTQAPDGDVVQQDVPELKEDGKWYMTWTSRPFTEAEIAKRLADAKVNATNLSLSVLSTDLYLGAEVNIRDESVPLQISTDALANYLSLRVIAQNGTDDAVYTFRTQLGKYFNDLTKTEVIKLVEDALKKSYEIQKACWDYIALVESKTKIEDIPQVPSTFIQ